MTTYKHAPKILALLLLLAALTLIFPAISRAISGLALVLFIPGYISTHAFFRKDDIDVIERLALSIGLSISFVVLTVMFSNLYLKIPITTKTIIIEIASVCIFFVSLIRLRESRAITTFRSKAINILSHRGTDPKKTLTYLAITTLTLLVIINITYPIFTESPGDMLKYSDKEYIVYDMAEMTGKTVKGIKISRPSVIEFENDLVFLGYDISPGLKRGEKALITYYFQSGKDTKIEDITVVTDFSKEKPVFQHQFRFPSIDLKKGTIISIPYKITIPKEIDSATYTISISLMKGYIPVSAENPSEIGTVYIPYYFEELYNRSDTVHAFHGTKNSTQTGIAITNQSTYIFENKIAFLGYDLTPEEAQQGSNIQVTYYWKSLEQVDKDYTVFVHITDPGGKIIFQHDHPFPLPTSSWSPGQTISEKYDLNIPPNINDSTYLIRLGLYDHSTGKRMSLTGKSVRDNAPYIGSIAIKKKQLTDYYNPAIPIKIIDSENNTRRYSTDIRIQTPVLTDHGPLIILGYELDELHKGMTSEVTYYIYAKDAASDYSIRTLLTETTGSGIISQDTSIPPMRKGETIALKVRLMIHDNYSTGDSIFTFAVKDMVGGKYLKSQDTQVRHITIKDTTKD